VVSTMPWPLYPWERPGTHCTEGWVGPRAGLDVCEKSRPHRDFFFLIAVVSSVSCTFVQVSFLCPIVLRAVDFSIIKNPTASVGSEPAVMLHNKPKAAVHPGQ
jgi:hypothetical protein